MKLTLLGHLLIFINLIYYILQIQTKRSYHTASQPISLDFKFNAAIDVADYIAYALVTNTKADKY